MLKPAILYKDQIERNFMKYQYSMDMFYETGSLESWIPEITESTNEHDFQWAIVDKTNKLIGFLVIILIFIQDV